jgi:PAS domain S-box-containing protein
MISDRDHEKLHALLIQELEDFAVFLVNLQGRITTWNPGVERFLGYGETEFIGRPVSDIFTPEDRAAHIPEREMENARNNGRAADVRWHVRNDQRRVFVEGVFIAIKDEAGEIVGFAKIARSVHQRHVAGSMLATILEGTEDAIYALDREGRFTFANDLLFHIAHVARVKRTAGASKRSKSIGIAWSRFLSSRNNLSNCLSNGGASFTG